jgi:hypothetical protein
MFRRRKEGEAPKEDFSDELAAFFERLRNLEARVEALERTVGRSPPPPPPSPKPEEKGGLVRGKTRRPFVQE